MTQYFRVEHEVLLRDFTLSIHAYKTRGQSEDEVRRAYYSSRDPYYLRPAPVITAIAADEVVYGFVRKGGFELEPVVEAVAQEVPAAQEAAYKVGDVITGKQVLVNNPREFVVVQVNRVSLDIKADNGDIHRVRPIEGGRFMHGKTIRFLVQKAA